MEKRFLVDVIFLTLKMVFKVLVTLPNSVLKIVRVNAEKTKYLGKFENCEFYAG